MWLAACLLALSTVIPVAAAEVSETTFGAEMISGYGLGDELYAFVRLDDSYADGNFTVTLQSDAAKSSRESSLEPLTNTSTNVRYVFMIDLSGSMRTYTDEVNAFLDALSESEQQTAYYTIATFGERFEVVSENITDKNTLKAKLGDLTYDEKITDPYTGVESAITYLDSCSRKSGDLVNLIVITDGEPDLGLGDEEEAKSAELAASLAEKINNTPEVIISTLCTAEWDETAIGALSNGRGIHESLDDERDAAKAGQKMASFVDGLYRTNFKLSEEPQAERFSVSLRMKGTDAENRLVNNTLDIDNIPNLKLFSNDSTAGETNETEQPDTEDTENTETETTEDTESTEGTQQQGTETTEGTESTEQPDSEAEPGAVQQGSTGSGGDSTSVCGNKMVLLIAVLVAIIVAIICFIILLRKKSRGTKAAAPASQAAPAARQASGNAIPMKLEVLSGRCLTTATLLHMNGELYIGSGPGCDITFADSKVAPQHARIVRRDNAIFIEDMNSPTGTFIGGMRIQGSNRLRSGDVISVGDSDFSLKF
jgi:hypothetical protein